jgi:hypothetical protein
MSLISHPPHCIRIRPISAFAPAPSLFSDSSQPQPLSRPPPRSRCERYRAMQTRTCPALRDANTNAQPLCYAPRSASAMRTLPLLSRPPPADENAPAQCPRRCERPCAAPLRLVPDTPPVPHRALPAPARYVFVPSPVPPQLCRPRWPLSNALSCPCPVSAHRPKASSCERARTVQTNANPPPRRWFRPRPPALVRPCPAVTFAAAPARCKRPRAYPHARHANIRPPNHANECERAPPHR